MTLLCLVVLMLFVALLVLGRIALAARERQATAERALEATRNQLALVENHNAELRAGDAERHRRELEALQRATDEKLNLVVGNRDEFVKEMEAVSGKVLARATEQVTRFAAEARKADRETTSGELKARAAEITEA